MSARVVDKRFFGKPKEKYWITYIKQRIKKNKNFLGFISAQTGGGKSYACLSICEQIDPDFDINRCVFSGLELMKLVNSPDLKRGSAIMFDEMSIDMDNRNWNSTTNKMINYLMQTFRYRGFIMLMNSPFMDFIDSKTRKLFHADIGIQGIDYEKKEAVLQPRIIQYNGRNKKFYYKRLKVSTQEFGCKPIDSWRVGLPSKKLLEDYDSKKDKYSRLLNIKIEKELNLVENPEKKVDKRFKTVDEESFSKDIAAGFSNSALCAKYNIGYQKCQVLKHKHGGDKFEKYKLEKYQASVKS